MATATKRGQLWSARWRDATGRWREKRTKCRTKTEALVLARDLEHKADRQRLGLEPLPDRRAAMSFDDLFSWWWEEYGRRRRSPDIDKVARKHLLPTLGGLPLSEVTPARLEGLLVAKTDALAPRSLNHLRGLVHTVFARAIKRDVWSGANPAALVERRKVPKRPPEYLQPEEAELLLVHLDVHWRPLFAAALFTGMRKGELLGLRKRDVNLRDGTILVGRSYDHDTTKGGHADLIPIAEPLRPFLDATIRESPSALVFPRPDGSMHPEDVKLDRVLRRALGRAGVVTGYDHRCRRKGCGYSKEAPDNDPGRCPRCNMRLWAKPLPRHVRFHDLRHTTATLLLKMGVPLVTVQRILRHKDVRLTASTYGHLSIEDLREGLARFPLGPLDALVPGALPALTQPAASSRWAPVGRPTSPNKKKAADPEGNPSKISGLRMSGRQDSNLRPLGPEMTATAVQRLAAVPSDARRALARVRSEPDRRTAHGPRSRCAGAS